MMKSITKIFIASVIAMQIFGINAFAGNNEVIEARKQELIDAGTGPAFSPKIANDGKENDDKKDVLKVESSKDAREVKSNGKTYKVTQSLGQYKTTAFTPEEEGNYITASGIKPTLNNTVSTDWSYIKPGTKILIGNSDVVYTVEDNGVKGKVVDIFLATNAEADRYGVQYKDIYIVEEVN